MNVVTYNDNTEAGGTDRTSDASALAGRHAVTWSLPFSGHAVPGPLSLAPHYPQPSRGRAAPRDSGPDASLSC